MLRSRLSYDPDTGIFTWKPRQVVLTPTGRASEARAERWNQQHAGQRAGWATPKGYRIIGVWGFGTFPEHRLAWLYVYGYFPSVDTDHINGDKGDNRIANLREASRSENSFNRPPPKSNKSGVKGVHFDRGRGKWMAYIKKDWKRRHLGRFDTMEEAIAARHRADIAMNGDFARLD